MANNTEKALVNAICNGDLSYIERLKRNKLNVVMKNGYSPLGLAISECQYDIVNFLESMDIDLDVRPNE